MDALKKDLKDFKAKIAEKISKITIDEDISKKIDQLSTKIKENETLLKSNHATEVLNQREQAQLVKKVAILEAKSKLK